MNEAVCFCRCLGEKLLQNNRSQSAFTFERVESRCFNSNIRHFFLFYAENAPKMQRMRILENDGDPYHRILSDALISVHLCY